MVFEKIEPNVFKFNSEGDELIGILVKVEDSKKYKNKVYHLEVEEDNGTTSQKVVFGSAVLDDRMSFVDVGDKVKIVYKGQEPNSKDQQTKIFEVYVDKE